MMRPRFIFVCSPRVFVLACIVCLVAASAAQAAPITFSFTAAVTDDPFGLSSFGAPISGSYTFDSSAADSIPGAATGSFASSGPGIGFTANVDGTNYSVPGVLTVNTANNIAGGVDQYGAIALDSVLTLELFLEDATGTALASDALPLLPPSLANFGVRQFRLFSADAEFLGRVDTLTCTAGCGVQPVPEPGSLLLVGSALAGFGYRRLRTRQSSTKPTQRERRNCDA
jgi:PEP-CTERM motif